MHKILLNNGGQYYQGPLWVDRNGLPDLLNNRTLQEDTVFPGDKEYVAFHNPSGQTPCFDQCSDFWAASDFSQGKGRDWTLFKNGSPTGVTAGIAGSWYDGPTVYVYVTIDGEGSLYQIGSTQVSPLSPGFEIRIKKVDVAGNETELTGFNPRDHWPTTLESGATGDPHGFPSNAIGPGVILIPQQSGFIWSLDNLSYTISGGIFSYAREDYYISYIDGSLGLGGMYQPVDLVTNLNPGSGDVQPGGVRVPEPDPNPDIGRGSVMASIAYVPLQDGMLFYNPSYGPATVEPLYKIDRTGSVVASTNITSSTGNPGAANNAFWGADGGLWIHLDGIRYINNLFVEATPAWVDDIELDNNFGQSFSWSVSGHAFNSSDFRLTALEQVQGSSQDFVFNVYNNTGGVVFSKNIDVTAYENGVDPRGAFPIYRTSGMYGGPADAAAGAGAFSFRHLHTGNAMARLSVSDTTSAHHVISLKNLVASAPINLGNYNLDLALSKGQFGVFDYSSWN